LGTMAERILVCGAKHPKNLVMWIRGGGTRAASLAIYRHNFSSFSRSQGARVRLRRGVRILA
jgi:hypothetical protein